MQISKNALVKKFQLHGEIEQFTLQHKQTYTSGFILYKSLLSAAKALAHTYCRINGQKVRVSAADSWHQPDSDKELNEIESKSHWSDAWPTLKFDAKEIESKSQWSDAWLTLNFDANDGDGDGDGGVGTGAAVDAPVPAPDDENGAGCSKGMSSSDAVAVAAHQTKLLDLNDDCLVEILAYLDVLDLCAVNQIAGRLHRNAQQVFRKHFASLDLSHVSYSVNYYELTLHKVRNLFQCFGASITQLKVAALAFKVENRSRVVDLIVRHCPNLKSLEFIDFQFRDARITHVQKFLGNLHELTLNRCNLHGRLRHLFRNCTQLKSLKIQADTNLNGACLELTFPQLESASLTLRDDISVHSLHLFMQLNPQLKSLELIDCDDEIFDEIATRLPQLERLSFEVSYFYDYAENLKSLLALNHLKELKLNCSLYPISTFVDALADKDTIELLHISEGVLNDHLIDALSKCKRLRSLKLCSMPNVHDKFLISLAKNLPNLNDFHIRRCQAMSNAGVLAFVEISAQLQSLSISNSTVAVDDAFFLELVRIYSQRSQKLTLNLLINSQLTPALITEHNHSVRIEYIINDFSAFDDDFSHSDDRDNCFDFDYDYDYDYDDDIHSDPVDVELFDFMNEMCLDGGSPVNYLW